MARPKDKDRARKARELQKLRERVYKDGDELPAATVAKYADIDYGYVWKVLNGRIRWPEWRTLDALKVGVKHAAAYLAGCREDCEKRDAEAMVSAAAERAKLEARRARRA